MGIKLVVRHLPHTMEQEQFESFMRESGLELGGERSLAYFVEGATLCVRGGDPLPMALTRNPLALAGQTAFDQVELTSLCLMPPVRRNLRSRSPGWRSQRLEVCDRALAAPSKANGATLAVMTERTARALVEVALNQRTPNPKPRRDRIEGSYRNDALFKAFVRSQEANQEVRAHPAVKLDPKCCFHALVSRAEAPERGGAAGRCGNGG